MLAITECSYAPSNCSPSLRRARRELKLHIMSQPFQRGLLAAVRDLVRNHETAPIGHGAGPESLRKPKDLIARLLWVADQTALRSFLGRP